MKKLTLMMVLVFAWASLLIDAADNEPQNLQQFLELPYDVQTIIAKYLLGDEVKKGLFDKPMVKYISQGNGERVLSAAFNDDETQIVSAGDDTIVRVWNVSTGQLVHTLQGHTGSIYSAVFNHDGTQLASASTDRTIRIWDPQTGQQLHILHGHERCVSSVAFNHEGTQLVSASKDDTIRIWDAKTGQQLRILHGHEHCINSVAFNHDGTQLVSASKDDTIRIWDAKTGQQLRILKRLLLRHVNFNSAAFNKQGTRIVSADSTGTICIWNTDTYNDYRMNTHNDFALSAAFNTAGNQIISTSYDTMDIWDTNTGHILYTLHGHDMGYINKAAFNTTGNQVVTASDDGTVRIWEQLLYERYHFNLEQALWIYTAYHEIMHGKEKQEEKDHNAIAISQEKRQQIIDKLTVEQSIRETCPEILSRLQVLRSEKING